MNVMWDQIVLTLSNVKQNVVETLEVGTRRF